MLEIVFTVFFIVLINQYYRIKYNFQKALLVILSCFIYINTNGQENDSNKSTTNNYLNNQRFLSSKDQVDIWSLNFGFSYLPIESDFFVSNSLAINIGLNFHYEIMFSFNPVQTLSLGVGYNHSRINHEGRFVDSDNIFWIDGSSISGFEKGNLRFHSMTSPLEYRLRLNSNFKLYLSYLPEYNMSTTDVSFIDGDKIRFRNLKKINNLIHGGQIRVGYKDFFLFCYYSFLSPFNYGGLNNQNMIRFGISIGG